MSYEPVSLPEGDDWLYRPVDRGWCFYRELKDGSLDISDIARMNDAIDARDENEARAREAARKK